MIKGIIAPNLTFFDEEGKIDEKKCKQHMDWMLSKGVNGFFVTGTYGSGFLLSIEERLRVYELAKEVSLKNPEVFIIAHTGCADTSSSIKLTKYAKKIGLHAVSAILPFHYKYTDREIIHFYSALVDAEDIPVFAYNNPEITGKSLSWNQLCRLEEIGVCGVKDSAVDIKLATCVYNDNRINNKNFQYISGTTSGWLAFRKLGVDSMIAGMCNYTPEIVSALFRYSYQNEDKAIRAYEITYELGERIKEGNSLVSSHISLKARGFDPGCMRLPLTVNYDDKEERIREIKELIEQALNRISELEART